MKIPIEVAIVILSLHGSKAWSYDNQSIWEKEYPSCGGNRQSPIEIDIFKTTLKTFSPLIFTNYNITHNVTISNNGIGVIIEFPMTSNKNPQLSGGPFQSGSKYEIKNIHFHWGTNSTVGSEHAINKKRFPMEIHAMHYNTKYKNVQEAILHPDGIVVLTTFGYKSFFEKKSGIESIIDVLPSLIKVGSTNKLNNFQLNFLWNTAPKWDKRTFATYKGSLTTPPCSEIVQWIIQTKMIPLTATQLNKFRQVKLNSNKSGNNWRELQKKFSRNVYVGFA